MSLLPHRLTLILLGASFAAIAEQNVEEMIIEKVKSILPGEKVTNVRPSPIKGIYEVMLGPSVLYVTEDGNYAIRGDVYDLKSMRNITDVSRRNARTNAFKTVAASGGMIEFKPEKETKHVIYVYTDIDCAYCRKMHREIDQLTSAGIAVRYLAFPRSGLSGESYDKAVSVWCAEDRQAALTLAKMGKKVPSANCDNPVDEHFNLGGAMGVRGTPAVFLEDGREMGGYIPAQRLIELFNSGEI